LGADFVSTTIGRTELALQPVEFLLFVESHPFNEDQLIGEK